MAREAEDDCLPGPGSMNFFDQALGKVSRDPDLDLTH
jgi:hypothetical protein